MFVTGSVEPANEQARVLAERFAGRDVRYSGSVNATNLKVSGVHVFSAGDFVGAPGTESITLADAGLGTYRKLVIEGGRLAGAVLYGDTADARWYLELLRSGASIESVRQDLVFGRTFAERKASLEAEPPPEKCQTRRDFSRRGARFGISRCGRALPATAHAADPVR